MNMHDCKEDDDQERLIYVTNDFLQQFITDSTTVPAVINLNSAKNAVGFDFDPVTDTIFIKHSGIYLCQFSVQVANVAFPPPANPNPLLTFELQKDGGTIISSKTSFNANSLDTTYVTSTLFSEHFRRGDRVQLVLSAPDPIPTGTVLRIDFASVTIFG